MLPEIQIPFHSDFGVVSFSDVQILVIHGIHVFRLPIRYEECTPEVQKMIRQRRMPKGTEKKEKDIEFAFDPMKYAK